MSCTINYNNNRYTEEEFIKLLSNKEGDSIPPSLINKLTEYISTAGIKVEKLSEYKKNLIERNKSFDLEGVQALVDFNEGVIAIENKNSYDFVEEVAHVAIELSPVDKSMERALDLVSETGTYKKNVEAYTKRYKEFNPNASKQEIDTKVRKEVLGKLVAKHIITNNKKGILARLFNALKRIFDRFISMFNKDSLKELKTSISEISQGIIQLKTDNLENNSTDTYFSLVDSSSKQLLEKTINRLKNRLKDIQYKSAAKKTSLVLENKIKNLEQQLADSEYEVGLLDFIDHVGEDIRTATTYIKRVLDGKVSMTAKNLNDLRDFIEYYTPLLNEIKRHAVFGNLFERFKDKRKIIQLVKNHLGDFDDINDYYVKAHAEHANKTVTSFFNENNIEADFDVKKSFSELDQDAWALQYWFGSLKDVSSNIARVVYATIAKAKQKINRITTQIGRDLINNVINELGVKKTDVLAEMHNGKATGYFKTPYNLGEFYKDYDSFIENLKSKYKVEKGQREPLNVLEAIKYNREIEKWLTQNTERKYTSEYYREMADLSIETREAKLSIDVQIQKFNNKVKDENGIIDYYKLSEEDRNQVKILQTERRKLSKLYMENGDKKTGVELIIAEELNALNEKRKNKLKYDTKDSEFEKYNSQMKKKLSKEEYEKWLDLNTDTVYTDEFFKLIDSPKDESKELKILKEKRKNLVSPYRNSNLSVNKSLMPDYLIEVLKQLDKDIQMFQSLQAKKKVKSNFSYHASVVPTKEYHEAARKADNEGRYDEWYAENHYAGFKGKMTPYSYWTYIVPKDEKHIKNIPNRSWSILSKDSYYYNKNFNENWRGMQPKLNKWASNDYNSLSENERKALDEMLTLKHSLDDKLPLSNRNSYLLPQISKSLNDMLANKDVSMDSMKELIKDSWSSRVDDTEFGEHNMVERPDGSIGNYVPVFYTKKLETPENVSLDLVSSMILYAKMATNYQEMSKLAPEMEVIKQEFGKVKYTKGSVVKKGIETNVYKMIENFLEMQVYGKTKEKTNDVNIPLIGNINPTKAANNINSYVRGNNLMFNFFTILSGYFNGFINSKIEDVVGQFTTNRAKMLANKEWVANISSAISEHKSVTKHNKVNVMLQHFRVLQNIENIFDNLDKNKFLRYEKEDLVYAGYGLGDYSLKANIALAVMFNYRYHNGEFYTEENFNKLTNPGVEYGDLTPIYDMYKVENGKFTKDSKIKDKHEDYLEYTIQMMSNRADGILSDVDRSKIHQSAWGQLVATHRGWLFQGIANRWKRKGVNYMTGEVESGSHRTFVTEFLPLLKDTLLDVKRTKDLKELWAMWDKLEPYQKQAVLRTTLEMAAVVSLVVFAKIVNSLADDDDDNYALEFAAYLSNRVLLETAALSLTPTPVPYTELITVLNSPVAGTKQIETIQDITDLLWGSEEITKGPYEGFTKREKFLYKLTPGLKGSFLLRDPDSANQFLKNKPLKYIY